MFGFELFSISQLAENKSIGLNLKDVSTILNFNEKCRRRRVADDDAAGTSSEIVSEPSSELLRLPNTAFFRENDPWLPSLGHAGLNEIEYSTNARFDDSVAVKLKWCPGLLHYMIRDYFRVDKLPVYANLDQNYLGLMTKKAIAESSTAIKLIFPTAVYRVDHRMTGDDEAIDSPDRTCDLRASASAKLRILQREYRVEGQKVKLSCSTEIDLAPVMPTSPSLIHLLYKRKSVTYVVYWFVTLTREQEPNKKYHFRVAFRREVHGQGPLLSKGRFCPRELLEAIAEQRDGSGAVILCNVECEDEIDGPLFLDSANALFAFYKFQLETAKEIDARISAPTLAAFMASERGRNLTQDQRALLSAMEVVARIPDQSVQIPNTSPLYKFVGGLGLRAWATRIAKFFPYLAARSKFVRVEDFDPYNLVVCT